MGWVLIEHHPADVEIDDLTHEEPEEFPSCFEVGKFDPQLTPLLRPGDPPNVPALLYLLEDVVPIREDQFDR